MLEVAAHMLLLERQARIKQEHPCDSSFLPVSLTIACLLRQLPVGLAPPSGTLSFHQIDCLPLPVLEQKITQLLHGNNADHSTGHRSASLVRTFEFLRSIVVYVKTARAMLGACHDHMTNHIATKETMQALVNCVTATLGEESWDTVHCDERSDQQVDDSAEEDSAIGDEGMVKEPERRQEDVKPIAHGDCRESHSKVAKRVALLPALAIKQGSQSQKHIAPQVAVDPSGIMKRAVARDIGDGSAIVGTMQRYPEDVRIQTHGVRALKTAIRKLPFKRSIKGSYGDRDRGDSTGDEELDREQSAVGRDEQDSKWRVDVVELVIANMRKFADNSSLQREALFCLLEYAGHADEHIGVITSLGGIVSIMEAIARMPDDEEVQIAALSILGHPVLSEESILRVNPEIRRLVLSAMRRFPLSERLQGLACLALANLSLRQDESMREIVARGGLELVVAAMTRFGDVGLVQAAGCWLLATISAKDEEMLAACLDAGGLPPSEKARVRFASDPRVRQYAELAVQSLVWDVPDALLSPAETECRIQ